MLQRVLRAVTDPAPLVAALGPTRAGTLHDGLPGTALLLAALSACDPHLARAAHQHWQTAATLVHARPADGIYSGPGALAASLIIGSRYLPRPDTHHTAVDRATAWLSARAQGLAHHQRERRLAGRAGTPWAVYDAIKGLSGIGRILLGARRAGHVAAAEPGLTAALTTLTHMITAPAHPHPGWWLPTHDHTLPTAHPLPPSGAATTGLAHGLAGPLAFLSLARTAGRTVPQHDAAIRTAATWLLTWQRDPGTWPAHIPGDSLLHGPGEDVPTIPGRRDAWCYGAAGIGNALVLAGHALHDDTLTHAGHTAMDAISARRHWDTSGPGLCHGTAGLLHIAHRHGHRDVARRAERRTRRHLAQVPSDDTLIADVGYLTGATGIALALADHAGLLPGTDDTPWAWPMLTP